MFIIMLSFAVIFGCGKETQPEVVTLMPFTKQSMADRVDAYLNADFPAKVADVTVTADKVSVTGHCPEKGNFSLVEIRPFEDVTEYLVYAEKIPVSCPSFSLSFPRKVTVEDVEYDRALSKWAVVRSTGKRDELVSSARYADYIAPVRSASKTALRTKKGLGAGLGSLYVRDMSELGIGSITLNVRLSDIISPGDDVSVDPYVHNGMTFKVNMDAVREMDKIIKEAYLRGIVVSAIILVPFSSSYADPECDGGIFAMPDLTTLHAVNNYAAAMEYLADRYTSGLNGRIDHWIIHNEVSAAKEWTNMGEQPAARCYDRYVKSMRLCYNIIRQYDQNASVMVSLTHSWTCPEDGHSPEYASLRLLERTVRYSEVEGDFLWGVAYHPYPVDLRNPLFWESGSLDSRFATFDLNAGYVTFYNPEVINEWILDRKNYYKGSRKRLLFFSEQGTNTKSYSRSDLEDQAAGAAWLWKKVKGLEGVDAVQWHAHCDNRDEFGLRLGLRNYDDYRPKPSWFVWKAAGTSSENEEFGKYLSVLGLDSWDDIVKPVK